VDRHAVMPSTGSKKPRFFYGYIIVLVVFLAIAVFEGIMYSFGVFLKPLIAEFGWTRAMTSGAYSLHFFLWAVLAVVAVVAVVYVVGMAPEGTNTNGETKCLRSAIDWVDCVD